MGSSLVILHSIPIQPKRRATPATHTYLSTQKCNGYTHSSNVVTLNDVPEDEESDDDDDVWAENRTQLSAAAQAAALCDFLSFSTSDSGKYYIRRNVHLHI